MSISIELKPELEEMLEQEAAAKGVSMEAYVEELREQQVFHPHKPSPIGCSKFRYLYRVVNCVSGEAGGDVTGGGLEKEFNSDY